METIQKAELTPLIKSSPKGLGTLISEMGYNLSGGEKERIGMVRIFLKDAPIIFLDEPFSGIDINKREKLKKTIFRLFEEKTVIVISHNEKHHGYDRIFHLNKGKINEIKEE